MRQDTDYKSRFWFVNEEDVRTTPSMDYHEHSKASEYLFNYRAEDPKKTEAMLNRINALAGASKVYDCYPGYPLFPRAWETLQAGLGELLQHRRTNRTFTATALPSEDVATLLVRALGVNGELPLKDGTSRPLRAHPSGGGLFPLETYAFLLDVEALPQGLHHFNPYGPVLNCLKPGDFRHELQAAFMNDPMVDKASMIVVFSAVFMRSRFKYAERSYRFVHLEAGHMMQNLILLGQLLNLSVVPVGGFLDRRLERLMDLDGVEESTIYAAVVGHPERT